MKTTELFAIENRELFHNVVAFILKKSTTVLDGVVWTTNNNGLVRYSPTTNPTQCFEATPFCEVTPVFLRDKVAYGYSCGMVEKPIKQADRYVEDESELVARCMALVYFYFKEDVPDNLINDLRKNFK